MLLKRNLLEYATIVASTGTSMCVLLNCITNISPISGIWFPLYILTEFLISVWLSFKFIQYLLRLNKPIKYDIETITKEYPYLSFLIRVLPVLPPIRHPKSSECREYDTNELSVISTVLERKLVSSWYMPYISQEIGFPFACKQMLDQIIGKTFQISNKIEFKDVFVGLCTILVSHLKEYEKTVKRFEKYPEKSIEALYKKSHPVFNMASTKTVQSADHCTSILRVIFKELVPWELWDTPHSELLVRILSKKMHDFIDNTLSDPVWLNDKLLTILEGNNAPYHTEKHSKPVETEVTVPDVRPEPIPTGPSVSSVKGTVSAIPLETEKGLQDKSIINVMQNIVEEVPVTSTAPMDIKSSPILRQKRGRQGRNEVKIYDRIIEGSVKTWDTDIDLQCISLGQDLLASLDGEITLSRLWGQDAEPEGSPNPPQSKSPQPLWFGEDDIIEVDSIDTSPLKESKKEHSPKPAELLKDLQSTVNQAKTKIGDLQVEANIIDVPCKQISSDEAAGMMEGLLDFGIAGLKKGLRFTGLSDDSQDKSPSQHRSARTSPDVSRKVIPEYKDVHTHREDNPSVPPLLKQHRVISQDSVPSQSKSMAKSEPVLVPRADSPEPEYEEAADLSTSIAKLRCLLQARAEEVWWEGAEEARGTSQRRPVDSATLADEYDMNLDRTSPGQTTINMQRLDKLFQRTVTGVFNSIKTAVGAEGEIQPGAPAASAAWTYVCTTADHNVGGAVARLVGAGHVEAALDSLEQLGAAPAAPRPPPEDFDEWCSSCGGCWCGACAVAASAGLVTSHVAHRLAALLLADVGESLLEQWLGEMGSWLRRQVFAAFERAAERDDTSCVSAAPAPRALDLDYTCRALLDNTPPLLKIFGEETLSSSIRLVVSSLSHKELNKDVAFRALDLLAAQFKMAAALRNPSFDHN